MDIVPQNQALIPRDPAAVAAAESVKAMVQARFIMAMQRPRNYDQARDNILRTCRRPAFAEKVQYSRKQGRKFDEVSRTWIDNIISGPSIRFAEVALREWGNCDTLTQVVYEDDEIRRIKIMVMDLETNAAFSKEISIKKTVERKSAEGREVIGERITSEGKPVFIVRATDEEVTNKENAQISKVVRNEGLRLIPGDIIDEAVAAAQETLRNRDAQDPDGAKKRILDAFSSLGVKPKEIEKYLGHGLDMIAPKELETLRGIYRAVKDGEATWQEYVAGPEEQGPQTAADEVTGAKFAERIAHFTPDLKKSMQEYLEGWSKTQGQPINELQATALQDWDNFSLAFIAWLEKPKPKERKTRSDKGTQRGHAEPNNFPPPEGFIPNEPHDDIPFEKQGNHPTFNETGTTEGGATPPEEERPLTPAISQLIDLAASLDVPFAAIQKAYPHLRLTDWADIEPENVQSIRTYLKLEENRKR